MFAPSLNLTTGLDAAFSEDFDCKRLDDFTESDFNPDFTIRKL